MTFTNLKTLPLFAGWLFLVILFEAIALSSLKRYSLDPTQYRYFIFTAIVYGLLVPYLVYRLLTYEGIGLVNFIWNIFSSITVLLIGIYIFREQVTGVQSLGIALGLVGIVLIHLGRQT
jgi:multidrug transporter EmrE-like cation transporter